MSFFDNTCKPEGLGGRMMVSVMNVGHRALADWGLRHLAIPEDAAILDCGCGGGANIEKLLKMCPRGSVRGVDYSEVSVEKSRSVNRAAIDGGRCEIVRASVAELPFEDGKFDIVTAFETVYFWPGLADSFREVRRVLKDGGRFFICNECSGDTGKDDKWTEMIDGMKIYRDTQLKDALEEAGFCGVEIHKNEKGWLCVAARKPAGSPEEWAQLVRSIIQ